MHIIVHHNNKKPQNPIGKLIHWYLMQLQNPTVNLLYFLVYAREQENTEMHIPTDNEDESDVQDVLG